MPFKCIEPGCQIRATYNNEGETKALYCAAHKKNGMINVPIHRKESGMLFV